MPGTPLNSMPAFQRLTFLAMCAFAILLSTAYVLSRPKPQLLPITQPVVEATEQPRYDRQRDVERVRIGERPTHFVQPTDDERIAAIGDLSSLPASWRPLFDTRGFLPIPNPTANEWLAQHPERHQSFQAYLQMEPNRPTVERQTIYLLPLDDFSDRFVPRLEDLRLFTETYFGMRTVLMPRAELPTRQVTSRINRQTNQTQWLTRDVLNWMQDRLPRDAYCMVAITMTDLYPEARWNYVFGQATLTRRVGVYSFSRFDPQFFGQAREADSQHRMLWRSCRLLAHETGHMFGMLHCVYYLCGMNGTNSQAETDGQPLALCPVCMRKLQSCVGFDPLVRHQRLERLTQRFGFTGDEHHQYGNLTRRESYESRSSHTGADE